MAILCLIEYKRDGILNFLSTFQKQSGTTRKVSTKQRCHVAHSDDNFGSIYNQYYIKYVTANANPKHQATLHTERGKK